MTRVGIVTGAAGGFGTAIAERLRADGLEVVAADLPDLDASDPASVDRLVTGVLDRHEHCLPLEDARALVAYGQNSRIGKILEIHQEDPGRIHIVLIRKAVGF